MVSYKTIVDDCASARPGVLELMDEAIADPDIVVGMLVIGGLGTLSTYLIRIATRPALRWKQMQR